MICLSFVGVIIGGPVLYALVNLKDSIEELKNIPEMDTFSTIIYTIQTFFGGNIFYGGLLGGLLAAFILTHKKPRFKPIVDLAAAGIPLFHFWGRIGCFLGGCCYGIESPFGFTMHYSIAPGANDVSRFPVQLLESFFNLCLFFGLHYIRSKNLFKNKMIFLYLACYSTGRFFLEFLRGDAYRGFFLSMSTSQNISIILFIFSVLMLKFYNPKKSEC